LLPDRQLQRFCPHGAEQVAQKNPADVDALLAQDCISTPGTPRLSGMLNEAGLRLAKRSAIRRFARYEGVVDSISTSAEHRRFDEMMRRQT
jgi:hypothetical protein